MLVIVAALWVCAFVVMFACMAREVTGLTRVVRVNVRTLPQSYVTHPVSLCHHVFADEDPVVFNPSSQDKRVGGVGVMEGGGNARRVGGGLRTTRRTSRPRRKTKPSRPGEGNEYEHNRFD